MLGRRVPPARQGDRSPISHALPLIQADGLAPAAFVNFPIEVLVLSFAHPRRAGWVQNSRPSLAGGGVPASSHNVDGTSQNAPT